MLKNLTLSLASFLIALYFADFVLGRASLGPAYWRSWELGVPYDTRDRLEFILDNRKENRDAFPALNALVFITDPVFLQGERVLPLGGVANAMAVGGNEGGFHSTHTTDEAGFNNPQGTWPLKAASNVFIAGDSFAYGDCVRERQDVASRLREHVPNVVNLGARGNGPLQELATIREYVPAGKVAHVFWMFYERNDLIDLNHGKRDPILIRYLEDDFRQNLLGRQKDINAAVRSYTERQIEIERAGRAWVIPHLWKKIKEVMPRKATNYVNAGDGDGAKPGDGEVDVALFKEVIASAKREVERKGGKFVFVYLPSYRRFSGEPLNPWANHKLETAIGTGTGRANH